MKSAELMARMSTPAVATLIRDQQFLFSTRQQLFQSQSAVLMQRVVAQASADGSLEPLDAGTGTVQLLCQAAQRGLPWLPAADAASLSVGEARALEANPQILQLRALEKWDGHLPRVTGGSVPFLNVDALAAP